MAEGAPSYPSQNYDFMLQAVFDMKGTLGELKRSIEQLTEASKEHDKQLRHVGKIIYAGGVLLPILGVIGMWVIGKLWEFVIAPAFKLPPH